MRNQTILVDINKETCKILKYKQYDNNNVLQIIVEENYKKINLNEYVGFAFFELPSGLIIKKECKIEDNVITIIIDNNVLSEEGKVLLDLTLSDGEDIFTLFRINLVIEETIDRDEAIIIEAGWDIVTEIAKFDKAEEQRVANEERRVDYENVRIANESDRQNEETKRIANEDVRVVNENERLRKEIERQNAEGLRIENEEGRVQAEASRVTAEQERVDAENSRVTRFNEMEAIVSGVDVDITEIQNDVSEIQNDITEIQNDMTEYLPLSGGTITGDLFANSFESIRTVESTDGGGTIDSISKTQVFTDEYGQGRFYTENSLTDTPLIFLANPHDCSYSVNGDFKPAGGYNCNLGTSDNVWNSIYSYPFSMFVEDNDYTSRLKANKGNFRLVDGYDITILSWSHDYLRIGPDATNQINLGSPDYRFKALYLNAQPDVSSDRTLKENIQYVNSKESNVSYEDMYAFVKDDLELATYNLVEHDKLNMGFIAQDLLVNLDGTDNKVGQMIVNPVPVPTEEEIAEGKPYPTLSYDTGMYTSVLAGALKEAINKIEQLEARINELENK